MKRNENYFNCFGCGEGGDSIAFVSKLFDIDMKAAAEKLADDFHIDIEERKPTQKPGVKQYLTKCHATVGKTNYWRERGISDESVKRFYLGFDTEKNCITKLDVEVNEAYAIGVLLEAYRKYSDIPFIISNGEIVIDNKDIGELFQRTIRIKTLEAMTEQNNKKL